MRGSCDDLFLLGSGLADEIAEADNGNDDEDGDRDIEKIAMGYSVLTQSHQMDAIVGIQQDRP
jgi:hypothetical protein